MNVAVLAECRFTCSVCGVEAAHVELRREDGRLALHRAGFTGRMFQQVATQAAEQLREAIVRGDIKTLHAHSADIACFYCPQCEKSYCGEHWTKWDVFEKDDGFTWHDEIRGRCPRGHERRLED